MDAAVEAVEQLGGADSAHGSSTLIDLRERVAACRTAHPVGDFLDLTA